MSYLNKKVYPLTTGSLGELVLGNNKFLDLAPFNLSTPYTIIDGGVVGIVSNGTNPIANAYVALKPSTGTDVYMVQTDANGAYSITAPAATNYQLNILTPGYDVSTTDSITVTAASYADMGTTVLTVDSELNSNKKAVLGLFKLASDSSPINDGIITLLDITNPLTPVIAGVTVTNSDGNYAFVGLDGTKTYKVIGVTSALNPAELQIVFGSGTFTILPDLSATPVVTTTSSLIQGIANDNTGTALANTSVMLFLGTSPSGVAQAYTKTNADGYYTFVVPSDVAARDYYVTATNNIPA